MKKIYFLAALTLLITCAALAQQKEEKGYWVVQSNVHVPRQSVVYFYNQQDQQVYKETVSGRRLNVNRRKVSRRLNEVLEQSLTAWQQNRALKEEQQLVVRR